MIKKLNLVVFIISLFFSAKSLGQYFDRNYSLASVSCCTIQSATMNFLKIGKNGAIYTQSGVSFQGYFIYGSIRCINENGTSWGVPTEGGNWTSIISAQPCNDGSLIMAGIGEDFYFDAAETIGSPSFYYYVKIDSSGNALWVIPRKGNYHVADKSYGFVSVKDDSTFKYDAVGNLVWQKARGAKNNACGSYDNDFYYLLDSTVLSKCDTAGNIIWSNTYTGTKLVADSMENIYIRAGTSIIKLDSAGNFIYSRSFASLTDYDVDKSGNLYILTLGGIKKYDTSGVTILWNYVQTSAVLNPKIGVDRNYRVYYFFNYENYNYSGSGSSNPIFLPPNIYERGWTAGPGYKAALGARISQDLLFHFDPIQTNNTFPKLCTNNDINVDFTINSYPVNLPFNPLFKVQLSDSSGDFSSATIIGVSNGLPITCRIPNSTVAGNNYRLRVITGDSSVIGSATNSFILKTSPATLITVTNAVQSGYCYYGCGTIPVQLATDSSINYRYQWKFYISGSGGGYFNIQGATNATYIIPSPQNNESFAVEVTDTSVGCSSLSSRICYPGPSNSTPPSIVNLPQSVCVQQSPILLHGSPSGGVFSGTGVHGSMFYPDSVSAGVTHINYSYSNIGCGTLDTTMSILVKPLPSAAITTSTSTTFCSGSNVVLNGPPPLSRGALTYQWKKGVNDIAGATQQSYTAQNAGKYKVTVTNTLTGCTKTTGTPTQVIVNALPPATITPQGPTTFCAGGSVLLSGNTGTGYSYKWKKGVNYINGATVQDYTATLAGNYRVEVTDGNGCSKTSAVVSVSVPCREAGMLVAAKGNDISIFPNPSNGTFQIQSDERINQLIVTNLSGQVILQHTNVDNGDAAIEIDMNNQAKGVYLLQLTTDKEVYNRKIILE